MAGRNLFERTTSFAASASRRDFCVFISYRRADLAEAREVADALIRAKVDIYFDEDDECVDGADEETDPERVLTCIDAGPLKSTHLLGLITPRTRRSWWVPYEIGATRSQPVECAFLIHQDVKKHPAYVSVSTILPDRQALSE